MPVDLEAYRQTLLELYLRLPDTPRRFSRFDLRLARQLWERQIPVGLIEAAFLLASARRAARRPDAVPLGPIRSLHYFLPVIEELLANPILSPTSPTCAAKSPSVRQPRMALPARSDSQFQPAQPASVQIFTFSNARRH